MVAFGKFAAVSVPRGSPTVSAASEMNDPMVESSDELKDVNDEPGANVPSSLIRIPDRYSP